MIYRLYNTAESRYATAEELKYLRVNADEAVERLFVDDECLSHQSAPSVYLSSRENYRGLYEYTYWQPAPEWVCFWLSPLITKIHLCDDCVHSYPECKGNPLFGDGYGKDNIYKCNAHEVSK